ncbi:cell division protein FtsW [Chromatiales bacterium (ex Bugula neritina AB1)]|nr:cell division protein FtsW [Chromatiales bacterium (ex Bugula neritina AB1)]
MRLNEEMNPAFATDLPGTLDAIPHARLLPEKNTVDWYFVVVVSVLAAVGLVMVFSASITQSEGSIEKTLIYGRNQSMFLALGVCAGAIVWRIPLSVWERLGPLLLVGVFAALVLVLIPGIGTNVNGSQRWIRFGVSVQPSEMYKVAVIIFMAAFFVRKGEQIRTRLGVFLTPLGIAAMSAIVLLLEPDFGATVVVTATIVAMMFIAGVRFVHLLAVSAVLVPAAIAAILMSPYRKTRLFSFLNPWDDPFDTDFQLTQSLIAVGRGSWDGVGLGSSVQKMAYLPEAHTDFVFAVMAEETGLIGVTLVIGLFALIVMRCFRIARNAERVGHDFGAHLATGIGFWFGLQTFINIGSNMGILPTKGIPLPLFSYGGSSMIMVCVACALVLRVSRESSEQMAQDFSRAVARRLEALEVARRD